MRVDIEKGLVGNEGIERQRMVRTRSKGEGDAQSTQERQGLRLLADLARSLGRVWGQSEADERAPTRRARERFGLF
jgi:hypothetical protein